ncbi:dynein axonemal intermediate chain 7 homolog [Daphnia pulex]|uniref:dynein axonemal intermediate chain 7 homolog n=1 Tax=Daphnia pulex TaxID=6669 RepID=UPI001EDD34F5|nr:dynein axonemal intermediate chain 7 homolog [Daphnia pulex]
MKSRKQLEAQQRYKKEQEERQRIKNEELRLEMERRRREQQEKEEQEARIKKERQIREVQLCRTHCERSTALLTTCTTALASWSVQQWQLKKFHWCMRVDGLPDPGHLPQLNAYRYRWIENSENTEPSMERLLSRAPELNQVLHDLNELIENTHDVPMKQVQQLCLMHKELSKLLVLEIEAAIKSVLGDVERHLLPDESLLNVQTCSKLFSLALGTDTAKNSSLTLHDFPRLGVKLDLPQIILTNMKPVVASFVWFKEGHFLEPPQLNGVPSLPTLLHPLSPDDPLYNFVPESMREPQQEDVHLVRADQEQPSANDVKPDDFTLDFDSHLLVMGVLQLQLLQLPIQPRRFSEWTVALLEDGDMIKIYEFHACFNETAAAKEAEKAGKRGKNDDDDEPGDGKEANEELRKLISFKIKLPPSAFWLGCPRPVIYQKDSGTWKSKGVWDVRFFEEIGGPTVQFRLEEPAIMAFAQAKRVNLPLQGWTLVPSHMRSSIINSLVSKAPVEAAKGTAVNETRGAGGGGGGGGGDGGGGEDWSDDEGSDDEEGGGRGGGAAVVEEAADEPDEIEYDPEANSITLTLNGTIVSVDIEIQEHQVLLRRVRTSICVNIQDLTNRPMTPFELIKSLRRRGLEISPSYKVSAMVDELAKNKNRTVEKHLYRCVALLAASEKFSFLHSRWNQLAGDENFVLQYQKLEKETMSPPALAQISFDRTRLLPFNESSLSLEQQENVKEAEPQFYADLLNALFETSPVELRNEILEPSPDFVETIYTMLAATRPISNA